MSHPHAGAVLPHLRKLLDTQTAKQLTDGQLLQRFATHGDDGAFAELILRHGGLVYGVCRHILRHEHDAEDAFQGTFLVLARKAGSIRRENALASWLHGVAYRVAMKARTASARRRKHETQAPSQPEQTTSSDLAWRELQAILDEELNRLPEKYRAPFVLCCLTGRSKQEAAGELGWKEGTVSSRLAHARKLLQERLTRRGVTLSSLLCGLAVAQQPATAALPAALAAATPRAALAFAAGEALADGAVSARAVIIA